MKALISSVSLAFLLVLGACSGEASMSADGIAKQFGNIVTQLESVKDKASAESIVKTISPMTNTLETTLASAKKLNVGNLMSGLTSKLGPFKDRLSKLTGGLTPDVAAILKPYVTKLLGMIPK